MAAAMEARQQDGSLHPGGISDPEEVCLSAKSLTEQQGGVLQQPLARIQTSFNLIVFKLHFFTFLFHNIP